MNSPDGNVTDLLWFLSELPMLFHWVEKRQSSCGFRLIVDTPWGMGYSSHFKSVLNEFQTVPDKTAIDLLQVPCGLPLLCQWARTDCQPVDIDSQWMDPEAGGMPGVSNLFPRNSKQFQMELWQSSSNYCLNSWWVCIGQNRVSKCGCRLSVDGALGRGCSKSFKTVPNEIQTVPDGSVTDLLWFQTALPLLVY